MPVDRIMRHVHCKSPLLSVQGAIVDVEGLIGGSFRARHEAPHLLEDLDRYGLPRCKSKQSSSSLSKLYTSYLWALLS